MLPFSQLALQQRSGTMGSKSMSTLPVRHYGHEACLPALHYGRRVCFRSPTYATSASEKLEHYGHEGMSTLCCTMDAGICVPFSFSNSPRHLWAEGMSALLRSTMDLSMLISAGTSAVPGTMGTKEHVYPALHYGHINLASTWRQSNYGLRRACLRYLVTHYRTPRYVVVGGLC
jgi:hypothetical protein